MKHSAGRKELRRRATSRRRHIPHSGRAGTWDHTTYFLVDLEKRAAREFYSLADAKEFAEKIQGGEIWLIR